MRKRLSRIKKIEILWDINYKIFNNYLDYYRDENIWINFKESWDSAKWNTHDLIYISEKSLIKFLDDKTLTRASKAKNYNGKNGSRAFVSEHIVPFNLLIDLYKEEFKFKNPSFNEYKHFFIKFNKIWLVWHEEDNYLNDLGFKKNMPVKINEIKDNIFSRYVAANIKPIKTIFLNPGDLFTVLKEKRDEGLCINEIKQLISKQ